MAPALQASLGNLGESLAVYSPTAPTFNPTNGGYQWFRDMGWTFRDADGLARIAVDLDAFIAQVAGHHNIPTSHIVLLGFSQGAMTVLHALPTLSNKPAAVISCSGALTVTPPFPATEAPQPILFIHGADDDVLPADTSVQAAGVFSAHGYPTQLEILPNLGHGIDAATLAHISVFLQGVWGSNAL